MSNPSPQLAGWLCFLNREQLLPKAWLDLCLLLHCVISVWWRMLKRNKLDVWGKLISEHRGLFYPANQRQSFNEVQKPSQKHADFPLQGYQALGWTGQLWVSAFVPTICSSSAEAAQLHAGVPWAVHSRSGWMFKTVPLAVRSAWIYFLSHHNCHTHSAICSSRVFHSAMRNQF